MHADARLPKAAYLEAIRAETLACADAAEAAGPRAAVHGCPGWDVAALVAHLAGVQQRWATLVRDRCTAPPDDLDPPVPLPFQESVLALRAGAEALAATLRDADPAEPVWTWSPSQQHVGFVIRHQAQEAVVHRYDAEDAAGTPRPIRADLAADAVDEFLHHVAFSRRADAAPMGGSVHLHVTDADGEWVAFEDADGALIVERAHGRADAAIPGLASDLLLLLYRRVPLSAVHVVGDRAVAERFIARTDTE